MDHLKKCKMPLQHFDRVVVTRSFRSESYGVRSLGPQPVKRRSHSAEVLSWQSRPFVYDDAVHNLPASRMTNLGLVFGQMKSFLSEYFSHKWKN